jgi:anti-anti-sigma regulatory factor
VIRLTLAKATDRPSIRIEGRLDADAVIELRALLDSIPNSRPVLDLSDLTAVDDEGRRFLIDLSFQGHALTHASLYVKHLLEESRP